MSAPEARDWDTLNDSRRGSIPEAVLAWNERGVCRQPQLDPARGIGECKSFEGDPALDGRGIAGTGQTVITRFADRTVMWFCAPVGR